ncbi:Multidrug resistance protein 1 [Hypsibius exemplaris]|uniref:Multidrug resistance protein 1 n=1 Tax=Hypsibius exemplaris TaxID=2072580 RepID=A0A1W0X6J5_HYPEX|nr:Multidrug resistance protein 1 [Hypsibius exemplaris]
MKKYVAVSRKAPEDEKAKNDPAASLPPVPLKTLFRFADGIDIALMVVGSAFAFVTGFAGPAMNIVFGDMTNLFSGGLNPGPISSSNETVEEAANFFGTMLIGQAAADPALQNDSLMLPPFHVDYSAMEVEIHKFTIQYVLIGCASLVASAMQVACWTTACERQIYKMRKAFLHSILRQEMSWFDSHESGSLTSRLSDDMERVKDGLGDKMSFAIQAFAQFVGGFAVGFYKGWDLTLVMLTVLPFFSIAGALISKVVASASTREQEKYMKAGAIAEEVLSCIRTVAAFGGQKREIRRYDRELEESEKIGIKKAFVTGAGMGLVFLIMYGTYSLAFWYGSTLLVKKERSVGEIFTVIFSVVMGAFSIGIVAPHLATIATAKGAAAAIFEVIDSVVKGVTVAVNPNETIALVGNSGCGKSTLLALLQRFYDPDEGQVLLDGTDIKNLNVHWLRSNIGVVSQMPVLFGLTIAENISLGREVTDQQIESAARSANIHDFIVSQPEITLNEFVKSEFNHGMATERPSANAETNSPAGRKQRIAIARALVTNPTILLLDEATSALDGESEHLVQAAIDKARESRATIAIAHRLSTIQNANTIYVMEKGLVAEQGTHETLLERKGIYHELVSLQRLQRRDDNLEGPMAVDSIEDEWQKEEITDEKKRKLSRQKSEKVSKNGKEKDSVEEKMKELKEEDGETPTFFRMLRENTPEWRWIAAGTLGSAILGSGMPAYSLLYGQIFEEFSSSDEELLKRAGIFWSLMFLALGGANGVGHLLQAGMFGASGDKLTHRLRIRTFQNILRQDMAYYDEPRHTTGKLTTRLATDAPMVKGATGIRMGVMVNSMVGGIAAIVISMVFGWKLGLAIIGMAPILILAGGLNMKLHTGDQKKDIQEAEKAGNTASEAIENIQTVQSLSQEEYFYKTYSHYLSFPHRINMRRSKVYAVAYGLSQAVMFFLYAGAFRLGFYLVTTGDMQFTDVFRVFFGISFVAMVFGQMSTMLPDYAKARISAGLILKMMNQEPRIDCFSSDGLKLEVNGEIEFRNVDFTYPSRPDVPILKKLSFKVLPGQTLAIVGASGCGKSTVVSLLERFYDPNGGEILIDGKNLKSLNLEHFRSSMAIVSQEPILFNTSIKDNISYSLPVDASIPDEKLFDAAKVANIHNFVNNLPDRYDTGVGEKGVQLSGGERQRVSIARAVIRDPKILLLDEATSALDSTSEKGVQLALQTASAGRTCIVIAHRLSTIREADVIIVMDKGQIMEQGTHADLLEKGGIYADLTRGQNLK